MIQAIEEVHSKRIVHLDIKPENFIMVNGVLKIIDFGLAHALDKNSNQLIFPGSVPGSFSYTAPENFRYFYEDGRKVEDFASSSDEDEVGETHVVLTQKADVWAAGIILYYMVYEGMHPFGTVGGGRTSKIMALKSEQEVEFPDLNFSFSVSNGLLETMKASLRKDPKERATVQELQKMDFLSGPILNKV